MTDKTATDDRERRVASGFPDPDQVPGPTERLRELHGEAATEPLTPKYGRATVATAGTQDYVPLEDMVGGSGGVAGATADRLNAFARKVGEETAERVRAEIGRRGLGEKAKTTGAGLAQIGLGGVLGLGALGATATAMIAGLGTVMPIWASALITAGVFGVPAAVLAVRGRQQMDEGIASMGSPAGA